MKKYLAELIENLAQRIVASACRRADEVFSEVEDRDMTPSMIYRASLPQIEYIEH